MTKRWPLFILTASALTLQAAEPVLLVEARRARSEAIPQVAIQKLRTLLKTGELPPETSIAVTYELAGALMEAGETEEALWIIQPLAEAGEGAALLLQAAIFTSAGRWSEAGPIYEKLMKERTFAAEAQLGAAECWQALNQPAKAIEALGRFVAKHPGHSGAKLRLAGLLIDAGRLPEARAMWERAKARDEGENKWPKYIEARLLLASEQAAPALAHFEELLQTPAGLSHALLFGATLGVTEARGVLNGFEAADGVLEKYISKYPESPYLEAAFRRLDEIYAQEEHPAENELKKNAQKPPARRAAFAQFYLARMYQRVEKPDKATAALETFFQMDPAHTAPLLPAAYLMQADELLKKNERPAAVRALEAAMRHAKTDDERAAIELRTALVHFRQGEGLLAANSFRRAAQWSPKLRQHAIH